MDPQPLSFTYTGRGAAPSLATPTAVDIKNWRQLADLSIQELRLTGTIDLSTAAQVIDFNAWLGQSTFAVSPDDGPYHREPVGSHQVELTDECAVTITASLTCGCDFSSMAIAILNLVQPMHNV